MLTGKEIAKRIGKDIIINSFDENRLNPNSYNLRLDDTLKVYEKDIVLDPKKNNPYEIIKIPEEGLLLQPGELYIGSTMEYTESKGLIPCISGRSSIGRLGINVHATAGFGDIGFKGTWTLEIFVVRPVIIYPKMEICQIYFYEPCGDFTNYNGKYIGQRGPTTSKLNTETI